MVIGELVYKITGDASQLNSSLAATKNATGAAGKGFLTLDKVVKATIIGALVGAAIKLKQFSEKLINTGSESEEVANKFNAVFSSIRDEATTSVNELARAYNLSSTAAQQLVGNTADILTGLGTTQKGALDLSLSVNALAADLASFNNIPVEQASIAITKALLGERESIKTLGIAIGEEDVKNRLLAEGKENLTGLALRQAKAEATLQLAMEQSKNAIGDVERSSTSLANKRKELAAVEDDLYSILGSYLQGPAKKITQSQIDFTRATIDSVQALAGWIEEFKKTEAFATISVILATISASISKTVNNIKNLVVAFKDKIFDTIGSVIGNIGNYFQKLGDNVGVSITPLTIITTIFAGLGNVMSLLGNIMGGVLRIFLDLGIAVKSSGAAILSFYRALSGKGTFQEFKDSVAGIGNSLVDLKNNAVQNTKDVGSGFKNFVDNTKKDAQKYSDAINGVVEKNKNANKNPIDSKPVKNAANAAEDLGEKTKKAGDKASVAKSKFEAFASSVDQTLTGVSNLITSIDSLQQAQYDAQIARLDAELQAELEAAGVAEETEIEKYQAELDAAIASGDSVAQAEAEKNLKRAQIEDKYQKEKSKLEYKAALANWEIQKSLALIQMLQAPLNAYTSALAIPLVGNFIAPALAALALATAAVNYQSVAKSKPAPPEFENGGIVPGSSYTGDNVPAMLNSKEMVLSEPQQAQLFELANGKQTNNNLRPVIIDRESMFDLLFRASKNNQLFISANAVVS